MSVRNIGRWVRDRGLTLLLLVMFALFAIGQVATSSNGDSERCGGFHVRDHGVAPRKALDVAVVLAADKLEWLPVRPLVYLLPDRPGSRVRTRVVDRHVNQQPSEVGSGEALDHMEAIGAGPAELIEPRFPIEAARVDDERVPLPLAGRVAHPGRIGIRVNGTPVDEDLPPEGECLVDDHI